VRSLSTLVSAVAALGCAHVLRPGAGHGPLLRAVELNVGESRTVELVDGSKVAVTVVALDERRDDLRGAVREARVQVTVNGQAATLVAGTYHLPVTVGGVQVDCPITAGYNPRAQTAHLTGAGGVWGLAGAVRLRFWPAGSRWFGPEPLQYPLGQRWFTTHTQASNEPSYVDGGEEPDPAKPIYYHWGVDLGGSEGGVEVVAATDGDVVSRGTAVAGGIGDAPIGPRYDVVYVRDGQGWFYRYSHLHTIDASVRLGQPIKRGQRIGLLGKEGGSGGWSHLHFDIARRQPSGQWGIEDAYAFLWEAYQRERRPQLIAVARPHRLAWAGDAVTLDGSRSWAAAGPIARHEWTFTDGTRASGPIVEHRYDRAGSYSEVLAVTDAKGRVDYDFAVVQVIDRQAPKTLPPTINANYSPTFGLRPGDPVTFKVRSFRTGAGGELWDFGDGTPPVSVRSDGNRHVHAPDGYAEVVHAFARPGHYLVRVSHTDANGLSAAAHLQVRVGQD
jgi:murein DD-endopeptidase MepM/ murein hydrolase activator NlpD